MSKVDIIRLDSVTANDTTATSAINQNFKRIQEAIENTLSRNGAFPNYMDGVIDMNSYRIINTAEPEDDLDVVNKRYLDSFVGDIQQQVAEVQEAAEVALQKANNAASSATSAAINAASAQESARKAAQDAATSAQAAEDISGYLEDPNLVAVGTDLRKGDDSLIAQAVDAAEEILSIGYAKDLSFTDDKLQLLDQDGEALGNSVTFATVATTGSYNSLSDKPDLATVATSGDYDDLLNKPTIPTVNNSTITITQGGVTKGTFTTNQSSDGTIALDAGGGDDYIAGTGIDITGRTISVTSPTLINTATGADSLTILGTVTSQVGAVNIGANSSSKRNGVAIGYGAQNTGTYNVCIGSSSTCTTALGYNVALGYNSHTTAARAIQIGEGTNSEANTLYVSTGSNNNWKLLGNDGLIPSPRLPISASVDSSSTNTTVVGAKLFYDTCGDIEALINAL